MITEPILSDRRKLKAKAIRERGLNLRQIRDAACKQSLLQKVWDSFLPSYCALRKHRASPARVPKYHCFSKLARVEAFVRIFVVEISVRVSGFERR